MVFGFQLPGHDPPPGSWIMVILNKKNRHAGYARIIVHVVLQKNRRALRAHLYISSLRSHFSHRCHPPQFLEPGLPV